MILFEKCTRRVIYSHNEETGTRVFTNVKKKERIVSFVDEKRNI